MNQLLLNMKPQFTKLWFELISKIKSVNWILLIAILFFLRAQLVYKIVGLLLTLLITRRNKIPFKEIPPFYYIIILICIVHFVIDYFILRNSSYLPIGILGIIFWGVALAFSLQMKNIVNNVASEKIDNTLKLFFILNFIVCLYDLFSICLEIGSINPYTYIESSIYYMSTGDHILGIVKNGSEINSAVSFFGVIYFFKKNKLIATMALISLLLTTSNLDNMFLISILIFILLFDKIKVNKAFALLSLAIVFLFYVRVSPENFKYLTSLGRGAGISEMTNNNTLEKLNALIEIEKFQDSVINSRKQPLESLNASNVINKETTKETGNYENRRLYNNQQEKTDDVKHIIELNRKQKSDIVYIEKLKEVQDIRMEQQYSPHSDSTIEKGEKGNEMTDDNALGNPNLSNVIDKPSIDSIQKDSPVIGKIEGQENVEMVANQGLVPDEGSRTVELIRNQKSDSAHVEKLKEIQGIRTNRQYALYSDSTISTLTYLDSLPGKLTSYIMTYKYLIKNVKTFMIGSGPGNYSSKLAFDVSDVESGSTVLKRFNYISDEFKEDHLKIYLYFFSQDESKHSVSNSPFSVYNQIAGEYGVLGGLALMIGYAFYFLKDFRKMTYGRYLIIALSMLFITSYWFENLTIVILFELMMFLDVRRFSENNGAN